MSDQALTKKTTIGEVISCRIRSAGARRRTVVLTLRASGRARPLRGKTTVLDRPDVIGMTVREYLRLSGESDFCR